MRWFLVVTAAVAAFLVIALGVGMLLPRRNRTAASGRMPAPPDRVWETLADFTGYAEWRPGVVGVEPIPDEPTDRRWREKGTPGAATWEVVDSAAGRRWEVRTVEHDLPFTIHRTFELTPQDGGTLITVIEECDVDHPAYRFLFRFLVGREARLLEDLRGLQDHLGENG